MYGKTWPEWWDGLSNKIGSRVFGQCGSIINKTYTMKISKSLSNIILIGPRGVGKTTMGEMGVLYLNRQFIDLDAYIEKNLNKTILEIFKSEGCKKFREYEIRYLELLLKEFPRNTVIATGGGVVEMASFRRLLEQEALNGTHIVFLMRGAQDIITYLEQDTTRPLLDEPIANIIKRRELLYLECANSVFFIYLFQMVLANMNIYSVASKIFEYFNGYWV